MAERLYSGKRRTPQEILTDLKNGIYSRKDSSVDDYLKIGDFALSMLKGQNNYLGQIRLLSEAKNAYNYAKSLRGIPDAKKDSLDKKILLLESKIKKLRQKNFSMDFLFAILSIVFLVSALVFTSFSLTGYSIFGAIENNFRFIGTGFFLLGLVFAFVYFKTKNKKRGNGKKK
jgi:hypothetical protein